MAALQHAASTVLSNICFVARAVPSICVGDAGAIGRVVCGTAAADADADAATAVARVGSRVLEAHALDLKGKTFRARSALREFLRLHAERSC